MKRAALLTVVVVVVAGCGSAERAGLPEPVVERHLVYEKVVGEEGIWIADVDGSDPRLLVGDGRRPSISPDGRWVAYSGDCPEPDAPTCDTTYLVSTKPGERPHRFRPGVGGAPTWTPDSRRIVGVGENRLVSIDVADGKTVELAEGKFWGWSVSPDGKKMVFARLEDPDAEHVLGDEVNLFVVDLDGGDAKRITDTGDAAEPVWGPKSIAFAKLIPCLEKPPPGCTNNTWGRHEIWRIQPDGSGLRTITGPLPEHLKDQGFLGLIPIDWSDDGTALLGGWSNEWGDAPMAVDPVSGKARQLHEDIGSDPVALSHDGRFALVEAGWSAEPPPEELVVLILPYEGGKPKLVARGAVSPSWNR